MSAVVAALALHPPEYKYKELSSILVGTLSSIAWIIRATSCGKAGFLPSEYAFLYF